MRARRESYVLNQIDSINSKLQNLFDELGLSESDKDNRERELYSAVVEALDNYVNEVTRERDNLKKQCYDNQHKLQSMLEALKDVDSKKVFGTLGDSVYGDLKAPYRQTCDDLQAAISQIDSILKERLARANGVLEQIKQLSFKIDDVIVPSGVIPLKNDDFACLDLSNSRLSELEQQLYNWNLEYKNRIDTVSHLATAIVSLWADLGTPQNEIDSTVLNCYRNKPEELGTLRADIAKLETCHSMLHEEKNSRQQRLDSYKKEVHHLWDMLNEDNSYIGEFEKANRGIGLNVLEQYQKELERLIEKKREHIHIFIQEAREKLQDLWSQLYFSEDEALQFTPAWTDVYTDASLDAHEGEIERLKEILEQRRPILNMIHVYQNLQNQAEELEAAMGDPSRLLSRGSAGRLLKEEQTRKRLAKQMPKVINDLQAAISSWEHTSKGKFMVNGHVFLDILEEEAIKYLPKQTPRRTAFSTSGSDFQNKQDLRPVKQARSPIKTRQAQASSTISTIARSSNNKNSSNNNWHAMKPTNVKRPAGRDLPPRSAQGVVKQQVRGSARPIPAQQPQDLKKQRSFRSNYFQNYSQTSENETPVPVRGHRMQKLDGSSVLRPSNLGKENFGIKSPVKSSSKPVATPVLSPQKYLQRGLRSPFREATPNKLNSSPSSSTLRNRSGIDKASSQWQRFDQDTNQLTRSKVQATTALSDNSLQPISNEPMANAVTSLTENWTTYDAVSSSDDEETDTDYLRWRQNAMTKLQSNSISRVSDFNWEKDTF